MQILLFDETKIKFSNSTKQRGKSTLRAGKLKFQKCKWKKKKQAFLGASTNKIYF